MKGILFINFLIKTIIFPTNQSKRASDNERTNEISRYKSQIKVQIASEHASERRVNERDISFESFKSLEEMPKVR